LVNDNRGLSIEKDIPSSFIVLALTEGAPGQIGKIVQIGKNIRTRSRTDVIPYFRLDGPDTDQEKIRTSSVSPEHLSAT
jgi:hypothetical protein